MLNFLDDPKDDDTRGPTPSRDTTPREEQRSEPIPITRHTQE